jgi:hypothetical protein
LIILAMSCPAGRRTCQSDASMIMRGPKAPGLRAAHSSRSFKSAGPATVYRRATCGTPQLQHSSKQPG